MNTARTRWRNGFYGGLAALALSVWIAPAWAQDLAAESAPAGDDAGEVAAEPATPVDTSAAAESSTAALPDLITRDFQVSARVFGYMGTGPFLEFLQSGLSGETVASDPLANLFNRNIALFLFVLIGGGLLLNLTPCVLPMIPINLGIIGAGAQASSRTRGFLLGGAYGLGITVAYGALGVVTVLTGTAFGALQSSPWFNGIIAVVFLILALAMFDVLLIDLSRFQKAGAPARAGSFGAAFGVGAVSALLAGACVAPVLISTLMLATTLYQGGNTLGILLPFLLGLGMALPWPFAGAGLTFLPKPGAWMNRVKQVFGVLVLLFALHYGRLAYLGMSARAASAAPPVPARTGEAGEVAATAEGIPWRADLAAALEESKRTGTPVFVDLWATWCVACMKMDRSTLREDAVVAALSADFVPVKVQCERPTEPDTAALMAALGAKGLPTYIVLKPKASP